MSEISVRPNWASPPGETILAVLHAKGININDFGDEVGLDKDQAAELFAGIMPVTPMLARVLAITVGSTAHFWMERQKQYRNTLDQLAQAEPELAAWGASFPIKKMVESGWLPKPYTQSDVAFELLDYFDIDSVAEWRKHYLARLGMTKFRTSQVFENDAAVTLAWIRRGEQLAEAIPCGEWNRENFVASLPTIKALSKLKSPEEFLPLLQGECAKNGVAAVVARSIQGCAASGATLLLDGKKYMLLLSARFLSDDQFWFTFFHEAGHLVLHGESPHIEAEGARNAKHEDEANRFAQDIILDPVGEEALRQMDVTPYSIARVARQCDVSPGVIVGQLQFRRMSPKLFNKFKIRYSAKSFTL